MCIRNKKMGKKKKKNWEEWMKMKKEKKIGRKKMKKITSTLVFLRVCFFFLSEKKVLSI